MIFSYEKVFLPKDEVLATKRHRQKTKKSSFVFFVPFCGWMLGGFTDADGDDHGDVLFVTPVLVAVCADEISLFKLNRQEDVGSRGDGKDEMSYRHRRRGPECKEPAEIKRMPNVAIENRSSEFQLRVRLADQYEENLS
jgi:hypothetical protein